MRSGEGAETLVGIVWTCSEVRKQRGHSMATVNVDGSTAPSENQDSFTGMAQVARILAYPVCSVACY